MIAYHSLIHHLLYEHVYSIQVFPLAIVKPEPGELRYDVKRFYHVCGDVTSRFVKDGVILYDFFRNLENKHGSVWV